MSITTESPATTRVAYRVQNPTTGELLREMPALDDAQAEAALSRAHAAFITWREVPLQQRIQLFTRFADLLDENAEEIGRQISVEMGKILSQSIGEIGTAVGMFRYYAEHAEKLLAPDEFDVPNVGRAATYREPIGVVLGVEPWNGPIYQSMRLAAPNLMLGNTVMVKPARITAGSTMMLDELFVKAGFPENVYQTVLITSKQVPSLIADARVRGVGMTGSDATGAIIGRHAGEQIKPVILELGGSDPFVVLDSADVQTAAMSAAYFRLAISGQVCASPKRLIATDAVADEFSGYVQQVFANQKVGNPLDPETTVGPLSTVSAAEELQEMYQDAINKGAKVLVAGGQREAGSAFFDPAVLTDVTPEMRIYHEEAFGPIAVIYRVANSDEAVRVANATKYGLSGSVYGAVDEARAVAQRIDTGGVGINTILAAATEAPFGGTKASGIGRELGSTGMDQFANVKTYAVG